MEKHHDYSEKHPLYTHRGRGFYGGLSHRSQGHKAVESVASAMNAEIQRETATSATGQVAAPRSAQIWGPGRWEDSCGLCSIFKQGLLNVP